MDLARKQSQWLWCPWSFPYRCSSRGDATLKMHYTNKGPIEIICDFGRFPIFRTCLACKLKKPFFRMSRWEGDAMAPLAHPRYPRVETQVHVRYLEDLRYPKIKLARAIKTIKYATDHRMVSFCLHFCTLQVQQLHCYTCEWFQKSYVFNITHCPSENRQMFCFLHKMGACGHCGDFSPDPNFGTP